MEERGEGKKRKREGGGGEEGKKRKREEGWVGDNGGGIEKKEVERWEKVKELQECKYWAQRYRLFSRFDEGVVTDDGLFCFVFFIYLFYLFILLLLLFF